MKLSDRRSIVAIDPMPRGLAYVFFEHGSLLDFGARWLRGEISALAVLDSLLDGCAADLLIVEDPEAAGCRLGPRARMFLKDSIKHVRRRGIAVEVVARAEVKKSWQEAGVRSREAIAPLIASRFPELQPLVPPRRKVYVTESDRANIFDAMTLLLHRFSSISELLGR